MARPRQATNVLQLKGAFAHDPKRAREDATTGRAIGDCPFDGPINLQQAWDYLVSMSPTGVLDERDRAYLEIASRLFVEMRNGFDDMHPARLGRLEMMLSKLGMTPVDSSRVKAAPGQRKNAFADD
jgi:hypothetical protein